MRAITKNTRRVTALTLAAALVVAVYLNWQYARTGIGVDEEAGMSREAIQAMYDYDWSVFNANRSYQNHTQEMAAPSFEQSEESYSPLMDKYQKAISVTDHYCETKSCFTWIGEIENERVLAALENLSELDLKILTLYVYAGYTESEIAMTLESKRITIHKRIERMTMFLKNF